MSASPPPQAQMPPAGTGKRISSTLTFQTPHRPHKRVVEGGIRPTSNKGGCEMEVWENEASDNDRNAFSKA